MRTTILALAVFAAAAGAAHAQPDWRRGEEAMADRAANVTRFKCADGGDITAQFSTRDARLVAIVDDGMGAHPLPIVPWTSGPPTLTWTDGRRTLTWSPGVQIAWRDGATRRTCGRGAHSH